MARKSPARDYRTELFDYEPKFIDIQVARQDAQMSYVEAGPKDAEPVVLLHGNPTWSFLYRNIIPKLAEKRRVIAPDCLGMGRSDKLETRDDYSLTNHLDALTQLMNKLELEDVTLAVHDWAGPIGLSWAVDHPERLRRLVTGNQTNHTEEEDAQPQRERRVSVCDRERSCFNNLVCNRHYPPRLRANERTKTVGTPGYCRRRETPNHHCSVG